MPIKRLSKKITKEDLEKYYPTLGYKLFAEKFNINPKTARNLAAVLKIKFKKRKELYCKECNKKIISVYNNKTGLCSKCVGKYNYNNRGAFTHSKGYIWNKEEIDLLKKLFYDSSRYDLCSKLNKTWISLNHKAYRLKLKRNPKFLLEGNRKGQQKFIEVMKLPENRKKSTDGLKKYLKENPQMLLNHRLRNKNQMTSIEKSMSHILDSLSISYQWNKMIKTKKTWRFPDFLLNDYNIICECDGDYWHKDKEKDLLRQQELEELRYTVLRFTDTDFKDKEKIKEVILHCVQQQRLNQ